MQNSHCFTQRAILRSLVRKVKMWFIDSKIAFISYEKQLRTICGVDLQHVHGLSTEDFKSAWRQLGLGSQVVLVSQAAFATILLFSCRHVSYKRQRVRVYVPLDVKGNYEWQSLGYSKAVPKALRKH